MQSENVQINQKQASRATLNGIIRPNFLAFDLDSSRLVYSKDGTSWIDFASTVDLANSLALQTLQADAKYLPATGIDASKIISGKIPVDRLPDILPTQLPLIADSLAALTTAQQGQLVQGSQVITSDGIRQSYKGTGDKTDSTNYIILSDLSPDWTAITSKPSTFAPSAHVHQIADVTGLQTVLDGKSSTSHAHAWTDILSKPTSLAGLSISASDTLFDAKYLQLASTLSGYAVGANTAISASDSVLSAFQKLQAQINNKQASGSYLTGNQTITLSGALSGSGTTSISASLTSAILNSVAGLSTSSTGYVKLTNGTASLDSTVLTSASSLAWAKLTGVPSTFTPSAHVHAWADITSGKPTTLSGYGITDAVSSSDSRLSDTRIPTNNSFYVFGNTANATNNISGTVWNQTKSGFYCSVAFTDSPTANAWTHVIKQVHNGGGWSFDIAANYGGSTGNAEGYFVRVNSDSNQGTWRTLYHSGNLNPSNYVDISNPQTIGGVKTFSSPLVFQNQIGVKANTVIGSIASIAGVVGNTTLNGVASLGAWANTTFAFFGHTSIVGTSLNDSYCLLHENNGNTYLNASTSRNIFFRNNNTDKMVLSGSMLTVSNKFALAPGASNSFVVETGTSTTLSAPSQVGEIRIVSNQSGASTTLHLVASGCTFTGRQDSGSRFNNVTDLIIRANDPIVLVGITSTIWHVISYSGIVSVA